MKKLSAILLLISLTFCLGACSPREMTVRGFAVGSEYYVTYTSSKDLSAEINEMLSSIEESFSVKVSTSVLARINAAQAGEAVTLNEEESVVLSRALTIAIETQGAFEPAILPLVKVWGFDPPFEMNKEVPPSTQSIDDARLISGYGYFTYSEATSSVVKTIDDACLDLGGAIKGYAAERVREVIKERCDEALVYVGGTIAAVGRDYEIGVTPPRDSKESYIFRFTLGQNEICATSGDYERYYLYKGERYHHILDASTGYPANAGVISATIISEDGMLADALATAVVVLGAEKGVALIEKLGAKGVIVTEEKEVISTGVTVTIKDTAYALR